MQRTASGVVHLPACRLAVQQGGYHGTLYDKLTDDTVLYDNLALARPVWAILSKPVVAIEAHSFFRA